VSSGPRPGNDITYYELEGFRYIYRPGAGAPTLLLLHGTGGNELDLVDLGTELSPSAALVSPRGRSPEGTVNRWFARFAPGVLDHEDVKRRAAELSRFVPAATAVHGRRPDQVWVVGFSNGANMAAATMLLYPNLFAGGVLIRPMLPLVPDTTPDLGGMPVYIASGLYDSVIPEGSAEKLVDLLGAAGASTTVRWADAGHRFSGDEVREMRSWLDQVSSD
jgi:predicted esterase